MTNQAGGIDTAEVEERKKRRLRIAEAIGPDAVAIVPGATWHGASAPFRQSNEFHYLVAVETPQSYLMIDGDDGSSSLFLPHLDPQRVRSEGPLPYAEDAAALVETTGVDEVRPVEDMGRVLARRLIRPGRETIYVPHAPGETGAASRDSLLFAQAEWAADPWDGQVGREARFIDALRARFPQIIVKDLSPILDGMRLIKADVELTHLRRAGRLSALGVLAAMRATQPGVTEYQLAALADMIYSINGAQGSGYSAIVASGTNAWQGHYWRLSDTLQPGQLVLMDYAPDVNHYTSDIGRVWPVTGRFEGHDRVAYEFVHAYHLAILDAIRPGRTADEIQDEVAAKMEPILDQTDFGTEGRTRGARGMLEFRGHLSHPVGMAVHDVGDYRVKPLEPGLVISIDPMMWIEDELGYVRVEDTIVITEDGYENLTDAVPSEITAVEAEVGSQAGEIIDRFLDS